MKKKLWAAIAAPALVALPSHGSVPAQTLVDSTDVPSLNAVYNIALTDSGHVSAIVGYADTNKDSQIRVIYKNGIGGTTVNIADTGANTGVYSSPGIFTSLANLALSRDTNSIERVTFIGEPGGLGSGAAVYSYNVNGAVGSRILGDGDNAPNASGGATAQNFSLDSFLGFQVNASGSAVFSGLANASAVAMRGSSGSVVRVADSPSSLTNFNNGIQFASSKKVLTTSPTTSSPTAVFLATNSGADAIVEADTSTAFRNRFATGTYTFTKPDLSTVSQSVSPYQLIDANHNAELFTGAINSSTTNYGVFLHRKNASGPDTNLQLGSFGNGFLAAGEMTESGHAAFAVGDSSGTSYNDIYYFDGSTRSTVASVGSTIPFTGLSVSSFFPLGISGEAPMVNDGGTVVFSALLSDSTNALLSWSPTSNGLGILLKEGDTNFLLDGTPVTLDFIQDLVNNANFTESGVLKDELSFDNRLAVGIGYNGGSQAIVLLSVPEPSTLLGATGFTLLLAMRRRKTK